MSQKRQQKGFKIEPKTKIQRTSKEPRPPSGTEDHTENVTTAIENNTVLWGGYTRLRNTKKREGYTRLRKTKKEKNKKEKKKGG